MKSLIILALIATVTSNNAREKTEMYYFCISHAKDAKVGQGKESVLITPVKSMVAEEGYAKLMSRTWYDTVQEKCGNSNGCTSDFNYYFNEALAKKQFEKTKKLYSDTSRYVIKTISLKAN